MAESLSGTSGAHSCWTCGFQKLWGWETFLGTCGWFETKGEMAKPIPVGVVDRGCRLYLKDEGRYGVTREVERPFLEGGHVEGG